MRRRGLRLGLALALLFAGASARAQSLPASDEAEAATRRGVQLRRDHQDSAALDEFRRAFELAPSSQVRAQIALAEQALGRWAEAETDLKAALDAPDAWTTRNREALVDALRTIDARLGTLDVSANVAGAELFVNGALVGRFPQPPVRVPAGSVTIEARAAGYAPAQTIAEVTARGWARESLTLVPTALALAAPPPAVVTHAAASAPATTSGGGESATRRTLGWVAIGAAGASLVAGVIGTALHEHYVAKYNNDAECPPGYRDAVCSGDKDGAHASLALAIGGYALGGALLAGGLWLLVTDGAPAGTVRVSPWLAPGGVGGALGAAF